MLKSLRALALLLLPFFAAGQTSSLNELSKVVSSYLTEKKSEWKLTDKDINGCIINHHNYSKKWNIHYLKVHQVVNGVRIFNSNSSVSIRDGKVLSFASRLFPNAEKEVNVLKAAISPLQAIEYAAGHINISEYSHPAFVSFDKKKNRYIYTSDLSTEKIQVDLVYTSFNNSLLLSYNVNIRTKDHSHWWNIRVDAVDGKFLSKNDWTVSCDFGTPHTHSSASTPTPAIHPPLQNAQSNQIASYRVYELPVESPNFGSRNLINDPSDPVASPFGWHDTDGNTGAEFTITRGNNVFAYDDIADQDIPGLSADGTSALTFDFPLNLNNQPNTYLDASTTNLFYVNNMMHDILAHYGFDESAGNFQQMNYSGQGNGGDYVVAECQDGGGTNNANFSTPGDGMNGWMQMYLWAGNNAGNFTVNSPGSIAGTYSCVAAAFGPNIVSTITEDVVILDDGVPNTSDACDPVVNGAALNGKIALVDRGTCNFADKVLAAQNEGAIAVLVANNTGGAPFAMGGNANSGLVTIPSVMISMADGNMIKNTINGGNNVEVTLSPTSTGAVDLDGSLDNGIVIHEYGHGVSNRCTDPINGNGLWNSEQGGEGWSDYFALLFTIKPADVPTTPRGMGTYALGESASGLGIRRYPYTTNMSVNPLTYGDINNNPEVHDIGEIWCATLWDLTWNLIDSNGYDGDWINGVDTTGNQIALNLVMGGMLVQTDNPSFLDSRDAILQADQNLYNGKYRCKIWDAFARRGMGFNSSTLSNNTGDETEGFDLPPFCMVPTAPPVADFDADTVTCLGNPIQFNDLSSSTPQSWHWEFGDGNTSTGINPTHTYSQPGTYSVTLTVTNTLGQDSIVKNNYIHIVSPSAPAISGDTLICSGFNTILTANVDPGNVCEWRDMNDSLLFTGSVYNTPVLNSNATYQVVQYIPTSVQNVGPLNHAIGTGGYHNTTFEGQLFFTTYVPVRIKSVWVDASGSGLRSFILYQNGNMIQMLNISVPDGQSRVQLDLDIPAPGNYEIGVAAGSNLFRNQNGGNYPYTFSGVLSITSCNSPTNPTNFYYYLYDWEVQEIPCTSPTQIVNVNVNNQLSSFTFADNGLTVTFNSTGAGAITWAWDFGNGQTSNQSNAVINYATPGNYTVSLTTTDANGCQSVTAHVITVSQTGINDPDDRQVLINYDGENILVHFETTADDAQIRIFDAIGQIVVNEKFSKGNLYTYPVDKFASEFLMINVDEKGRSYSKKVVVTK